MCVCACALCACRELRVGRVVRTGAVSGAVPLASMCVQVCMWLCVSVCTCVCVCVTVCALCATHTMLVERVVLTCVSVMYVCVLAQTLLRRKKTLRRVAAECRLCSGALQLSAGRAALHYCSLRRQGGGLCAVQQYMGNAPQGTSLPHS